MESRFNPTPLLLVFALLAFGLAGLSVADMFLPHPSDGVILETAAGGGRLVVADVVQGSGAQKAGIEKGDVIAGIDREAVVDLGHAARVLNRHRVGDEVLYLVRTPAGLVETRVQLGRRHIGDGTYLYAAVLGFSFFVVGLFVLLRQPARRTSQVFFLMCGLFLLFLVCRMRPPSYSGLDPLILGLGTVAFLFLPPVFLHFYLLFPRPVWEGDGGESLMRRLGALWRLGWPLFYALPLVLFVGSFAVARLAGRPAALIGGVPPAHWWLTAAYMLVGLAAMAGNARRATDPRERRGLALVLVGSLFGLLPFLVASVGFATFQYSPGYFFAGIMPLVLVPITFAYAVVRFQLLDIRVILRRSLLYTVTTAVVTGLYAAGIATFNALFRGTALAASGYFPIVLALAIVVFFDPVRRGVQGPIDRFFFAGRSRLQQAMVEMGEAVAAQVDLQAVVHELMEKLPRLLELHFAGLYLRRGSGLDRVAGPATLPESLPSPPEVRRLLERQQRPVAVAQLGSLGLRDADLAAWVRTLEEAGVEVVGELRSRRRHLGLVVLSAKRGQIPLEREELDLLQGLLNQVALALETSLLLEERTQKAELERELEIAATIQARLLPDCLRFAAGWQVAAVCRPARIVGGDFFAQLVSPEGEESAVIFGDVSGKSVSGALMMMAAHEALHALALIQPRPEQLFRLANRRVYALGRRNFVALGYLAASPDGCRLRYVLAGQPPLLLRRRDGTVVELPLPGHRIPVGALGDGAYECLEAVVGPGELVVGYSDGVTDARAPSGELFGDRLAAVLAAAPADPDGAVAAILAAVDEHTENGIQYDDLTLVAVGRPAVGRPAVGHPGASESPS